MTRPGWLSLLLATTLLGPLGPASAQGTATSSPATNPPNPLGTPQPGRGGTPRCEPYPHCLDMRPSENAPSGFSRGIVPQAINPPGLDAAAPRTATR